MRQLHLLIFFFLNILPNPANSQFSIGGNNFDYCTSTNTVLYLYGTNPNRTYAWSVENYASFPFSSMIPLGYGTSQSIPTNFSSGAMVHVNEYDASGNLTGHAQQPILYHSSGQTIPYQVDFSGCKSVSVPEAFNIIGLNRWAAWYVNGVEYTNGLGYVIWNGPFYGTTVVEYRFRGSCGDTISTGPITINGGPVQPTITATGSVTRCDGDSVLLTLQNISGSIQYWELNNAQIPGTNGKPSIYAKSTGTYYPVMYIYGCYTTPASQFVQFTSAAIVTGSNIGCTGDSILLSCNSAASYQWKRNGANISGATTQTIYVKQTGTYEVVTSGFVCNNSTPKLVTFYPKATVSATPSGSVNLCSGEAVALIAGGTNISTFQWYRNNVAMPGGNTASITITKNGNYKCIVTNVAGCTKVSNTIQVTSPVAAALPKTTLVLQPDSAGMDTYVNNYYPGLNFGSRSTIEVYYNYYGQAIRGLLKFDLAAIPAGSPVVSASLKLYADTFNVYSNPAQTIYFKRIINPWAENNVNYLTPHDSTDFQYTAVGSSTVQSKAYINATITDLVKHWVKIPAENYGMMIHLHETTTALLSLASSDNAVVSKRPKLTVTYNFADIKVIGSTNICTGGSVMLKTNSGSYTYQWFKNGSAVPGATDSLYTVTSAGNYKVTIYNSAGCNVTSKDLVITQNAAPIANVLPAGNVSFCQGSYIWLTADSLNGYTAFQWRFNGNSIAGATQRKYKATLAGTYTVQINNSCGATATSAGVNCNVITNPIPTVTANGPTTFCAGQSVTLNANAFTGVMWQWRKNGIDISGAVAQNFIATTAGGYSVRETANGCSRTSGTVNVTVNCRTALEENTEQIRLLPQPFSYFTLIELPEEMDFHSVQFEVHDMQGKLVAQPVCTGRTTRFERGELNNGIYILQVRQMNLLVATQRMMIID